MNENWPRWIIASVNDHFDSVADLVTGEVAGELNDNETVEVRVNGPYIDELSKDDFKITATVNVVIQSVMSDLEYHNIHRKVGKVLVLFTAITVKKFGDGVDDDQTELGCFRKPRSIQVNYFGEIEPQLRLEQASVSAEYEMYV